MKKTVVIGISSGIAAYKTLVLVQKLQRNHIPVRIVMTEHTTRMLPPDLVTKETGLPVISSLYPESFDYKQVLKTRKVEHIELADSAAVFVIAPATANILAKLVHGIADDILTTTALAVTCPVIICPSMNVNMWNNPVVQENLSKLRSRGYIVIEPGIGPLACGYDGKGRLAEIETIYQEIQQQFSRSTALAGKTVVITSGGTAEPIDEVRSITNKSSGKMACALAEVCYLHGAKVVYLHAKNAVLPRYLVTTDSFETADDLEKLLTTWTKKADIVIHAAAVSDYIPQSSSGKLSSKKKQTLTLFPRNKILNKLKDLCKTAYIIGFKAEVEPDAKTLIEVAKKKLAESGIDMIIANDISKDRAFGKDTNEVHIVTPTKTTHVPLASKIIVAGRIIEEVISNLTS